MTEEYDINTILHVFLENAYQTVLQEYKRNA
jgi:hypothetical protein